MSNCFIYGLKDPNTSEIRYIGQTSQGLRRPRSHFTKSSLTKKTHRTSWIKSLNGSIPEIIVLEYCLKSELNQKEIEWIDVAKNLGWSLTNHTSGGGGTRGFTHTEASKTKIGDASRRMWQNGSPIVYTEEIRRKCGNSRRGKIRTEENKRELARKMGCPEFKVYDLKNGSLIGRFNSISECSRTIGEFRKTISWALFKNKHVSKRFRFERVS